MIKIIYWPSRNKGLKEGDRFVELDRSTTGKVQLDIGDYQCVLWITTDRKKPRLEFNDGFIKAL